MSKLAIEQTNRNCSAKVRIKGGMFFMKNTWKVLSSTAFSAVLLAGTITASTHVFADAASDETTNGRTTQQGTTTLSPNGQSNQGTANGTVAQPPAPPAGGPGAGERPAPPAPPAPPQDGYDHAHGKITAISGNTITIEKPPAPGEGPGPDGVKGKKTSKRGTVEGNTYSNSQASTSVAQNTYGQTVSFTISSSTKIVKVSHSPETGRTEKTLSLSDLQVGDDIGINLEQNTQNVVEIEVHTPPTPPADGQTPPAPPAPGEAPPAPPTGTDAPPAPPTPPADSSNSSSSSTGTSGSSSSSESSGS